MTDAISDLERFFRQIVRNLASTAPSRLQQPLPLADLRDSIVPYRANRRALELESSEDYELVLMRLCAGEGGFARTAPPEVQALFAATVQSNNPDLATFRLHEDAEVTLDPDAVALALEPGPDLAFAPPEHLADRITQTEPVPPRPHRDTTAPHCGHCGSLLPSNRLVKFCPHCGGTRPALRCFACEADVERGWRFCISCGASL
jgi:hypothetical protein